MTPGEIEQTCERVKESLARAEGHKQAGAHDEMRGDAQTAAMLFQPVLKAGDPLGMLDRLRAALRSYDFSDEECDELLGAGYSPTSMKKAKKPKKDDKDAKAPYVQPQYHKPPGKLKGFPNAVPVRKKGGRKRWIDKKAKRIYEWDSQHGHVEGWDSTGKKHQGAFNPDDGTQVGLPDPSKKPITPTIVTPMKKKERYALAWYSVEEDTLVGEEDVQLSQDTVRKWFYLPPEDTAIECYDVTASQRRHLMKLVEHEIDLNEYVYQLEGRAEEE